MHFDCLIFTSTITTPYIKVLILVLMDNALRPLHRGEWKSVFKLVLILVLMDNALRQIIEEIDKISS